METKKITLINEFGKNELFEILDEQVIDDKEYIVAYPTENAEGLVVVYVKENGNYLPANDIAMINKVYENFQKRSNNIRFVKDEQFITEGEVVEFNNRSYICFKVIEFEGDVFTYFMSSEKPIDIKFTKQVFVDGEDTKLEIIGDFYEKEKALSLLQRSQKDVQ